jgi:four helix bundle protein
MQRKPPIRSFRDLEVYQLSYRLAVRVAKEILPLLPANEKYDLYNQLSRSSKAIPRLIAEGYAKRQQIRGFQKYLDDALAEDNETIVSIEMCRDIFGVDPHVSNELVELYDKVGRQLYNLSQAWTNFKRPSKNHFNIKRLTSTHTSSPNSERRF